jgi:hypothetical protein
MLNHASGLPRYMEESIDYIGKEIQQAISKGRNAEGLRHFGAALHVIEDFFCHTNMAEISLFKLGHKVILWAEEPDKGQNVRITSGAFGSLDVKVSILGEIADHLREDFRCEPGKRPFSHKIALICYRGLGLNSLVDPEFLLENYEQLQKDHPLLYKLYMYKNKYATSLVSKLKGFAIQLLLNTSVVLLQDTDSVIYEPGAYYHSQMSKDHDVHPLHCLAAALAKEAVNEIGFAMRDAYNGRGNTEIVMKIVRKYVVHPQKTNWMDETVHQWAASNRKKVEDANDYSLLVKIGQAQRKLQRDAAKKAIKYYDKFNEFMTELATKTKKGGSLVLQKLQW